MAAPLPPGDATDPVVPSSSLARSAGLLSLGSAGSRALGLVREMVIASYFGASGEVSAFRIASQVPTLLYDLLVGGMLSAALVPVLSDYARRRDRTAFVQLVSVLLSLFAVVLSFLSVLLVLAAPGLAQLLAGGFATSDPGLLDLTADLIRLSAPVVWLISLAGVVSAVLYALHRFSFPAAATALYNLGIIAMAPLLASRIGVTSLMLGILAGSLVQFSLLAWDLRRAGLPLRPSVQWRHPAVPRIARLYLPVAAGLAVALFQVGLDRRLASGTGEQSIAWMSAATTLQQLPLGLISVAISLAALPRLSQHFAASQTVDYRTTLGRGLRMVAVLMAPAAVGLWLLGEPITRLLFQRNQFTAADTYQVVQALNIYVLGMLCAALDFLLNYAFYARNNTTLPATAGVLSVAVYVVVAFALLDGLGYLGLVWADTAKQASHALIMAGALTWMVGRLHAGVLQGLLRIAVAALVMALVLAVVARLLAPFLPQRALGDMILIAAAGGSAATVYLATLHWLRVDEAAAVEGWIRQRLRR